MNRLNNKKTTKKYSLRQALSSITGKITIIIITLIIPINIISLVMLANNFYSTRRKTEREITNSLELAAANLQSELGTIKKSLLYETFDNEHFTSLMDRTIEDSNRKYDAVQDVSLSLKKIQQIQSQIHVVFFNFPKNDTFVATGSVGLANYRMNEMINECIEENETTNSIWKIKKVDNIPLFINVDRQRNFTYGIVLQLNQTSSRIKIDAESGEREVFLGNEDGSIISGDGVKHLNNIGMDLNEADNSRKYFVSKAPVGTTGLYVYEIVSYSEIDSASGIAARIVMLLLAVFTVVAIPVLIIQMRRLIITPLDNLNEAMDIIESGETDYRIEKEAVGIEFQHINESFNAMLDQLAELKIDVYEHEIEERNIRLEYLSQQVQPHFILNALNILYSYEPEEYGLSQKMIMCISKYFRHIVYANDKFVSLKSEMDHVSNYFEIQKARFPELFYSIVEYDESISEARIPPLIMQTFAENAIKTSLKIGNRITIFIIGEKYTIDDLDYVRIRIADTGEGISDLILEEIETFRNTGIRQEHLGVGIQNTIERLKVLYGDRSSVSFSRDEHYPGTNVELLLPLHFKGESPDAEKFI